MPIVSVIIPAFNCQDFVAETIQSALVQTFPDIEILIVDDGSSDNTRQAIEPYARRIQYIYQENAGVGAARNRGISMARGKYLAFLDHDDIWLPDKLEAQIRVLEEHPDIGLLFSDCLIVNSTGTTINRCLAGLAPQEGMVFNELFLNNFIPLSTVVVPHTVLEKVGGFRSDWSIAQDYDLWLRIARTYPVHYVARPLAKYRYHSGGSSRRLECYLYENMELMKDYFERYPELRALRSRKLGRIYYDAAFAYLAQGHLGEARRQFLNVIRSHSYVFEALFFYALSFLGLDALEQIRTKRRSRVL